MGNSLKKKNHTLGGLLPNSNTIFGQHLIVGNAAGDVVLFASPCRAWEGVSEKHAWVATLGVAKMCIHTSPETHQFLDNLRLSGSWEECSCSDECDLKTAMGTHICTWNVCWE
jgi:hypothetical protein